MSANPISCESFRQSGANASPVDISIDVDGSGPLKAFPVTCEFFSDGRTTSHLVVGASIDYRDGFVVCVRDLMVNGRHLDKQRP